MTEETMMLIMMPMLLVAIPVIIHSFKRIERLERKEIRDKYTELIREKLDVIKTALAMGRDDDDIAELDRRLERLIGTEKMLDTLNNPSSEAVSEAQYLASKDIVEEMDRRRLSNQKEDA